MESLNAAEERLLNLARGVDFARRYYTLVGSTRSGKPCHNLPTPDIAAALAATGRSFRFNRREWFYATREVGTPGELGLNLAIDGSVEFILVARVSGGHIGRPFHGLALELAQRFTPELIPSPRYPRPGYRDGSELRRVLTKGLALYADLASAILAAGLLGDADKP